MRACILAIAALIVISGVGCRGINLCNGGGCGGHSQCGGDCGGDCGAGASGQGDCGQGDCGQGICGRGDCGNGICRQGHLRGHLGHGGGHRGHGGGLLAHAGDHFAGHHLSREYTGPAGPPTAQVAYPYYTTRGPRDFLLDNPPSIGR